MQKIIILLSLIYLSYSSLLAQSTNRNFNKEEPVSDYERTSKQPIPKEILECIALIQELVDKKEHSAALEELKQLNICYPQLGLFNLYLNLADSFEDTSDWRNAIKAYEAYLLYASALADIPIEEYWNIAWAYYMTGRPQKALEMGFKFANVYPNHVLHNLNLALYNLTLGYEMEAIYLYMWSFSVTLDPSFLYRIALRDLQKAKNLLFYAHAKRRLARVSSQLETLDFVQENL